MRLSVVLLLCLVVVIVLLDCDAKKGRRPRKGKGGPPRPQTQNQIRKHRQNQRRRQAARIKSRRKPTPKPGPKGHPSRNKLFRRNARRESKCTYKGKTYQPGSEVYTEVVENSLAWAPNGERGSRVYHCGKDGVVRVGHCLNKDGERLVFGATWTRDLNFPDGHVKIECTKQGPKDVACLLPLRGPEGEDGGIAEVLPGDYLSFYAPHPHRARLECFDGGWLTVNSAAGAFRNHKKHPIYKWAWIPEFQN